MEKGHAVYSTKSKILRGIVWVLMLILALFMVFPILYIILGSFKENSELLVGGTNILPSHWVFSNYSDAWKQANFATYTCLLYTSDAADDLLCYDDYASYIYYVRICIFQKEFPGKRTPVQPVCSVYVYQCGFCFIKTSV